MKHNCPATVKRAFLRSEQCGVKGTSLRSLANGTVWFSSFMAPSRLSPLLKLVQMVQERMPTAKNLTIMRESYCKDLSGVKREMSGVEVWGNRRKDLADPIEKFVPGADQRQEPRGTVVET